MSVYKEERTFFLGISGKPNWLTWTEYRVLQFFYVPDAPCEPDTSSVAKRADPSLIHDRIKTEEQAWSVATKALKSGRDKVRSAMFNESPVKIPQPAARATAHSVPSAQHR